MNLSREDLESHEIFVNKVIEGSLTFVDANCSMSSARSVSCCSDRRRCHSCERVFTELYFPTTGPEGGRALKLHRRPATGNTTTFVAIEPPPHKRQNKIKSKNPKRMMQHWKSLSESRHWKREWIICKYYHSAAKFEALDGVCVMAMAAVGEGAERELPRVHDTCSPQVHRIIHLYKCIINPKGRSEISQKCLTTVPVQSIIIIIIIFIYWQKLKTNLIARKKYMSFKENQHKVEGT